MSKQSWEERQHMIASVKKAVRILQSEIADREQLRAAGALVLQRVAPGFCTANKISEENVAQNVHLRELFLKDLLREERRKRGVGTWIRDPKTVQYVPSKIARALGVQFGAESEREQPPKRRRA